MLKVLGVIVLTVTLGAVLLCVGFMAFMAKWADREDLKGPREVRPLILTDHGDLEVRRPSWPGIAARQHNLRDEELGALPPPESQSRR